MKMTLREYLSNFCFMPNAKAQPFLWVFEDNRKNATSEEDQFLHLPNVSWVTPVDLEMPNSRIQPYLDLEVTGFPCSRTKTGVAVTIPEDFKFPQSEKVPVEQTCAAHIGQRVKILGGKNIVRAYRWKTGVITRLSHDVTTGHWTAEVKLDKPGKHTQPYVFVDVNSGLSVINPTNPDEVV